MSHSLRILYSSNAPFSTSGYGVASGQLLPQIKREGYDVAMLDFYGLEGGKIMLDGVIHYPKIADPYGADALLFHSKDFKADIVVTQQDIGTLTQEYLRQVNRWVPYVPVDHDPIPPHVVAWLRFAYRVATYTKFGQKELAKNGIHSTYIPLTVETDIFKPMDKAESRKSMGIPEDIFLFGMVAANKENPPRKSFQEAMDAFVIFHKKFPKSGMYFHTITMQQGGFPIESYAAFLGISDSIYKIDPYVLMNKTGRIELAKIYNAFDCLLAPSLYEGFCVPIIEAQSCGVPVITNNFTSMPELIIPGKTGFLCDVAYKRFTVQLSYGGVPDVTSIYKRMEEVYKRDRKEMGRLGREWVLDNFDQYKVFQQYWKPFLQQIEYEVYPQLQSNGKTEDKRIIDFSPITV